MPRGVSGYLLHTHEFFGYAALIGELDTNEKAAALEPFSRQLHKKS